MNENEYLIIHPEDYIEEHPDEKEEYEEEIERLAERLYYDEVIDYPDDYQCMPDFNDWLEYA